MSQLTPPTRRPMEVPARELMNNFYSKCCDCGTQYSQISDDGPVRLECPTCGLTATLSDINQISQELERDQPCPIVRMEVEQDIPKLFPKNIARSSALGTQDR